MEKNNAFGMQIPEIREIAAMPKVEAYLRKRLGGVLNHLEISDAEAVVSEVIKEAKGYAKISDYELSVHKLFNGRRITQRIPSKLGNRAELIFSQVKSHLTGHHVLDLGCGDGKVGSLISKQGREVVLADVYENGGISNLGLPFVQIKQAGNVPFDDSLFDTTLLLTVLHHSDNPLEVLREAKRVTKDKGRVLVIESVYGVPGYSKNLSVEETRLANIFFDHFYNRIIHYSQALDNKVNVPFNFHTPLAWKKLFEANNLVQLKVEHLGFDQPAVPEYHTLHVLEVRK